MKRIQLLLSMLLIVNFTLMGQTFEWGSSFGGIGEDVVKAMAVDDDGNVYSTGYFTDTSDLDPTEDQRLLVSNGFYDIFLQKVDSAGNFVGAFGFGGEIFDYGTGVEVDNDGNIYLTGVYQQTVDFDPTGQTFELTSTGAEDIFALKLSPQGQLIWARSMGSPDYEEPVSIGTDDDGNVYISGYFSSTGDYDPGEGVFELTSNGGQDAFVVKLDQNGNFLWAHNFGGTEQELVLGMDVNPEGDTFITGLFASTVDFDPSEEIEERSPINNRDGYVLKLNTNGEFVYATVFGGNGDITAWDVALDTEGNAYAAGGFNGEFSTGLSAPLSSIGFEDAFVTKINVLGDAEWTSVIQGTDFQNAYDVNTDPFGNVILAGYFGGEADFDPSDDEFLLVKESTEPFDAFVSMLSPEGELLYAANFGGSNFIDHHGVDTDSNGNIYLSAAYQNTVDINPSPDDEENSSVVAFRDSYIIKLTAESTVSVVNESLPEISMYPNPTTDRIMVEGVIGTHYRIIDALGKTVDQGLFNGQHINISNLSEGFYFLKADGYRSAKIVKQ
jgi:hypothetical protein